MEFQNFDPSLFLFLKQLAKNNNRAWFQENKTRYEKNVLEPALAFIRAFRPRLKKISEYFTAIDRRSGGSLMRVYRDTRFHGSSEPGSERPFYKSRKHLIEKGLRKEFSCPVGTQCWWKQGSKLIRV